MTGAPPIGAKGGMTTGLLIAGTVGLLALPSAVLAFNAGIKPDSQVTDSDAALSPLDSAAPASSLSGAIPVRSLAKGRLYLFTPAKNPNRPDRSVTVAVRIDPLTVKGISGAGRQPGQVADAAATQVRISPTGFTLGVSRGYRNFAQDLAQAGENHGEMPDLTRFSIAPVAKGDESRFSPRIVMDERATAGRAPRTFSGDREDQVDVGGSYRLSRNLDVTAGVRYSQDRERLMPLTDGKQDSQAVYVGTQFRF